MVSASAYRIASLHASGAKSNADQVMTGLGSAAQDPCAVPHRWYLLSCRASGPARQWAATRHTKVTGFSPSHIPGWWREHFIRLQRICILAMEGAQSPAERIISHLGALTSCSIVQSGLPSRSSEPNIVQLPERANHPSGSDPRNTPYEEEKEHIP